jgi:MshEN domain
MAQKIGEILISERFLTRKQLEEALKCQVIFGGRLGTNLVEMGIVEELDLLKCLSKQMEMPYVSIEKLMSVPPEVIKLIPQEIAEEYKIIPLMLEKKRLTVAMWDPSDLSSIDAISFITGYIIMPVVCSELRLILALEQYYGVKREVRYIKLQGGKGLKSLGESEAREEGSVDTAMKAPNELSAEPLSKEAQISKPTKSQVEDSVWGELADILPMEPVNEPAQEILPVSNQPAMDSAIPPKSNDPGLGRHEGKPDTGQTGIPLEVNARQGSTSAAPLSRDDMLAILAEARDRDAIANAVISFVSQEFNRVALFMVKGKTAAGWKGRLRKEPIPQFGNFQISLEESSILKTVTDTKLFYLGPVLDTPSNREILDALGGGVPETALLIPLMMMGRVVTIFYVDAGKDLGSHLAALQKIAGKTALAFEILILKNKILLA